MAIFTRRIWLLLAPPCNSSSTSLTISAASQSREKQKIADDHTGDDAAGDTRHHTDRPAATAGTTNVRPGNSGNIIGTIPVAFARGSLGPTAAAPPETNAEHAQEPAEHESAPGGTEDGRDEDHRQDEKTGNAGQNTVVPIHRPVAPSGVSLLSSTIAISGTPCGPQPRYGSFQSLAKRRRGNIRSSTVFICSMTSMSSAQCAQNFSSRFS